MSVSLEVNGQPVNVDVDRRWFTIPIAADDSGRVEVQIRAKQPVCTVDADARQFYVRVFDGALTGSLGADAARAAEGG